MNMACGGRPEDDQLPASFHHILLLSSTQGTEDAVTVKSILERERPHLRVSFIDQVENDHVMTTYDAVETAMKCSLIIYVVITEDWTDFNKTQIEKFHMDTLIQGKLQGRAKYAIIPLNVSEQHPRTISYTTNLPTHLQPSFLITSQNVDRNDPREFLKKLDRKMEILEKNKQSILNYLKEQERIQLQGEDKADIDTLTTRCKGAVNDLYQCFRSLSCDESGSVSSASTNASREMFVKEFYREPPPPYYASANQDQQHTPSSPPSTLTPSHTMTKSSLPKTPEETSTVSVLFPPNRDNANPSPLNSDPDEVTSHDSSQATDICEHSDCSSYDFISEPQHESGVDLSGEGNHSDVPRSELDRSSLPQPQSEEQMANSRLEKDSNHPQTQSQPSTDH